MNAAGSVEQAITFGCEGAALVGILHLPTVQARTIGILIVVGGPQYRVGSHRQFVLMARAFARAGWPVLRFDYRGMGDSGGEPRTFEDVEHDIRAAMDAFCAKVPDLAGVAIWGLCDAASAALMYCSGDSRLRGLVLANPWARTDEGEARAYLKHYYAQRFFGSAFWRKVLTGGFNPGRSLRDLFAAVGKALRPAAAGPLGFIDRMRIGLENTGCPVLVLISEHDLTAQGFMDLRATDARWRAALSAPKVKITRLGGADHTFSTRAAFDLATEECGRWLAELA